MLKLTSFLAGAAIATGIAAAGLPAAADEGVICDYQSGYCWVAEQDYGYTGDGASSYEPSEPYIYDGGGGTGETYSDGSSSYYSNSAGYGVGTDGQGCYYTSEWSNC